MNKKITCVKNSAELVKRLKSLKKGSTIILDERLSKSERCRQ